MSIKWLTQDKNVWLMAHRGLARKVQNGFTAAVPPEPTATPFSGEPGSELTVTIPEVPAPPMVPQL